MRQQQSSPLLVLRPRHERSGTSVEPAEVLSFSQHNLSIDLGKCKVDAMGQQFPLLACRLSLQAAKEFTELLEFCHPYPAAAN